MQFSLRTLILAMTVLAVCAALLGRITMNGTVIVKNENQWDVERVLGNSGFQHYNLCSSSGGTRVDFPKPLSINSVDDAILKDAQKKGYCVEIQYNALFPQFSSKKIVNPEIGLYGRH